ncbi:MAG: hypothetical protein Q8R24_01550 [Legionellaceae bacterium]|nr:hypothetical protein [Legionellaceae bacterium]
MQSKIQSEQDAQEVWNRFHRKHTNLYEVVEKKAVLRSNDTYLDEKRVNASVASIQRWWKNVRSHDTLIPINLKGNHHSAFTHLVNNQNIKRSLHAVKQEELLHAMHSGNWNASIFQEETLPQLAMSLFASKKITQQQIYSILERHQISKDYPIIANVAILDDDNQFTKDAVELLLPTISNRKLLRALSAEQKEEFRLLVLSSPKSEQYFYITDLCKQSTIVETLGRSMMNMDAIYLTQDNHILHLSSGARDALGIARFGEDEYVRAMPRLGIQTKEDIEDGVRKRARYAAMHYPGSKPYGDKLHGWAGVDGMEATSHDIYHSNVMSTTPKIILKSLWRCVDIVRESTQLTWSKEIWEWIDFEFKYSFNNHKKLDHADMNEQKTTELFCDILSYGTAGNGPAGRRKRQGGYLNAGQKAELTLLGTLIYLDMIKNKSKWSELKINPNYLLSPFKEHFQHLNAIYPDIKNDSAEIQWAKCLLYVGLMGEPRDIDTEKQCFAVFSILDRKQSFSEKQFRIEKTKGINTINLMYQGEILSCDSIEMLLLEAEFIVSPSLINWINYNPWIMTLCAISIVGLIPLLIYAGIQVWIQHTKNKQNEDVGVQLEIDSKGAHKPSALAENSLFQGNRSHIIPSSPAHGPQSLTNSD